MTTTNVNIVKSVTLDYGVLELRSDNILKFTPDIVTFKNFSIPIFKEMHEVCMEITEGIPRPYLADVRYITGILSHEEKVFVRNTFSDFASKSAFLSETALFRMIFNSYMAIHNSDIPMKLFKKEKDAVAWLLK